MHFINFKRKIAIFWFRRDLRVYDNAGLYHALRSGYPVLPLFIFDRHILDALDNRQDRRVAFIHHTLAELKENLRKFDSDLLIEHGTPVTSWEQIIEQYNVAEVYTNHDYEPYSIQRDQEIEELLNKKNIRFKSFKDQVIFEKQEILTDQGTPYTVFTPYSANWKNKINDYFLSAYPIKKYLRHLLKVRLPQMVSLEDLGFEDSPEPFPPQEVTPELLEKYEEQRNYPAIEGTSRLGIHLRFGTVSIREIARKAYNLSPAFLNELIWRDFYQQILWNFPKVGKGFAFRPEYDLIKWRNNEEEFKAWCNGKTGYPLVDAGMHELNQTGFMHNRVRMVVASFLSKHLLIDWRWGEAYFAEKLLDYDFASNNGGWQWAAGSGTDAAPYFRIFNPAAQTEKFDHKGEYIKKWLPELNSLAYPAPIVDHKFARERCLRAYKEALAK